MSSIVPTIGRIVLCFCPARWQGSRPGIIVRVWGSDPSSCANVQVFPDGTNDKDEPNWWTSVRVHDPADAANPRPDGLGPMGESRWCEWMPYQKGQAAMTEKFAAAAGVKV